MKLFISFLPALFSLCIFTAYSQQKTQNPEWIIYNTSNSGLPNNNVTCIAIDLDGKKWIGLADTQFVSFDDSIWTVYGTSSLGIKILYTYHFAVDTVGNLWAGVISWDGSVLKFDGNNWTVYDTSNSDLPFGSVNYIGVDTKNNEKWFATDGLMKFDDTNWTLYDTSNSSIPSNSINHINVENFEVKWMRSGGLTRFDDVSWLNYNSGNSGLPSNDIRAIAVDAQGNKWLGVYATGLVRFDGSNWTIDTNTCIGTATPYSITIDAEGTKWMGGGAWLAKLNDTVCQKYNQSNSGFPNDVDYVTAIAIDKYGNKWLGCPPWMSSINGGVAVFREGGVILSAEDKRKWEAENQNKFSVLVYPNPFSRQATMQITNWQESGVKHATLRIYDLLGRKVKELNNNLITNHSITLRRNGLPDGIYFYELTSTQDKRRKATGKFVIVGE